MPYEHVWQLEHAWVGEPTSAVSDRSERDLLMLPDRLVAILLTPPFRCCAGRLCRRSVEMTFAAGVGHSGAAVLLVGLFVPAYKKRRQSMMQFSFEDLLRRTLQDSCNHAIWICYVDDNPLEQRIDVLSP